MTCGQVKQMLIDLALAEAGPAERKRVQDHVQECEACRGRLADLDLTRKLLLEGLPQEEVPRRIAFVAANEGAGLFGRSGLWRRAFAVSVGVAAAVALLVGALALARVRVVLEQERWEIAFGASHQAATQTTGSPSAGLAPPAPGSASGSAGAGPVSAGLTREQVAGLVDAAVRQSEARQQTEAETLIGTAVAQLERRQRTAFASLAGQMRYFERTQTILYKDADRNRLALKMVASRLPAEKGERP